MSLKRASLRKISWSFGKEFPHCMQPQRFSIVVNRIDAFFLTAEFIDRLAAILSGGKPVAPSSMY